MTDLLRQAHPNTLVPGGGRDPFCAPIRAGAITTWPKLAQGWVSLIDTSAFSPFANSRRRVRMTTVKRLIGVPGAARRPREETGPVSGHSSSQAFSAHLSVSPSPRLPCLLWALIRPHCSVRFAAGVQVACDAAMGLDRRSCPNSTGAICPVFGETYDQGKFEANRACTRRRYLTSCVSLAVGSKEMEGLQRFQPEHRV